MKISCDACQAKYSISDDKVQGKVFKIRCKKCSHIIVVRGVASAAAPEPEPPTAAPDAVWHLVIDQEQVGPLTVEEVEQRFTGGEISSETFGWREGFSAWLPLAEIDAFAALGSRAPATNSSKQVSSMFGTGSRAAAGDDLFAAAAPSAGAAETHAAQRLRGERNESSVLFSLTNLAQIAESSPRRAPAATPASATPNAGAATGEGSGLIDIRSMASAYLGASGSAASKLGKSATASTIGSMDDLPVFGGGHFAEPAVIMPTARPANDRKLIYIMIAALAMLAIFATVLIVMLVGGDAPKKVAAVTPPTEPAKPDVTPPPEEVATATPPTAPEAPAPKPADKPAKSDKHLEKKQPSETRPAPARPAAAPSRPAAAPAAAGGCEEVECVINGYEGQCCARFRRTPAPKPEPTKTNAPDSLDRSMISAGIDAVKSRVMACGNKSPAKGKVLVKVSVAANGSVKNVAVESTPDPALGACVVANVQKASFASTKTGGSFRVPFTF